MDISLEFDIDYTNDNIPGTSSEYVDNSDEVLKDYIRGKINDVKLYSKLSDKNCEKLKIDQKECLKYLKETEYVIDSYISIKGTWMKIYNGRWVIGICVQNTAQREAENVNIILKDYTKQDLNYILKMYTKYTEDIPEELTGNKNSNDLLDKIKTSFENVPIWTPTQNIIKETTIIIILSIPKFIDFNVFELQGIMSYELGGKNYQKQIPKLQLSVQDILSDELSVKRNKVLQGDEESFLSILSTNITTSVRIIIPEGMYRTLEGVLQLDCFFAKTEMPENIFIYEGNCENLNYSMIKIIPGKEEIQLLTTNEEQLYFVFHHLYKNIPDVIILSEDYEQRNNFSQFFTRPTQVFVEPLRQDQNILKEFIDSFDQQLNLIENKIKTSNSSDVNEKPTLCESQNDYKSFRKTLVDYEKKTDELFLKVVDKKM